MGGKFNFVHGLDHSGYVTVPSCRLHAALPTYLFNRSGSERAVVAEGALGQLEGNQESDLLATDLIEAGRETEERRGSRLSFKGLP